MVSWRKSCQTIQSFLDLKLPHVILNGSRCAN